MNDYSQMSMVEVAVEILKQNEGQMKMLDLLEATLKAKELEDSNNELATRLYLDITTSALFVYMGNEEWDLKSRRPIKEYDRDGSEFNTKPSGEVEENDEVVNNYSEDLDDGYEDFNDDADEEEEGYYENDDSDDDDEDYTDENDMPKYRDDDEYEDEDGNVLKRYTEDDDDFDEDKYNDYMDDFEDMYDDR